MLGSETVVLRGDVARDADNNAIPGSGTLTVEGCLVEPLTVDEAVESSRDARETVIRVYLPITSGVDGKTTAVVRGLHYRIDADAPAFLADDDPELSGYVVTARRTVG